MKVQDVMTRNPRTCRRDETVNAAAQTMWENDIGFLPVVDAEYRVVGVVTDRDLLMGAFTQGRSLSGVVVDSVMARDVATCIPGDDVTEVEQTMQHRQLRRIPVVDSFGQLAGVITLGDLARSTQANPVKKALTGLAIARTLAAICEPRSTAAAAE